jgi:hypothetical protein
MSDTFFDINLIYPVVKIRKGCIYYGISSTIYNMYEEKVFERTLSKMEIVVLSLFPNHEIESKEERRDWVYPSRPFTSVKFYQVLFKLIPKL